MRIPRTPHSWTVTPRQAVAIQRKQAVRILRKPASARTTARIEHQTQDFLTARNSVPKLIAGADLAFSADRRSCIAGVVVWDTHRREVIEQVVIRKPVTFPYVPGLLSFRETPAILAALRKLRTEPDAFLFDGQGYAHPRRFGLACHVGLILDRPSVGCAKSLLVGSCTLPDVARGSTTAIEHNGETVGMAVRTRENVKPMYISVGHRLTLSAAVKITLACSTRYRLPEPTRLADQLVASAKSEL